MKTIHEPSRSIPVVETCDVVVVGGSCTGVFAALRAARLGARVALIEQQGCFGGTATAGLVNIWHSLYDTTGRKQIIGGLTQEIIDSLIARDAAVFNDKRDASVYVRFNAAELVLELDDRVTSQPLIRSFLHTRVVGAVKDSGAGLRAVILENGSGRQAVCGRVFIDATGNADLLHHAGAPLHHYPHRLPPTTCALYAGLDVARGMNPAFDPGGIVLDPDNPAALKDGFLWFSSIPGLSDLHMVAGTRVNNVDACDGDQLTFAEFEGRRQVRRSLELLRAAPHGGHIRLAALPAHIGIRDTRHAHCRHRITETEVLEGTAFPDTIGHGSYRVDVHFDGKPGLVFRYLDGREEIVVPTLPTQHGRWREPRANDPTFYNIPFRSLLPEAVDNLLVAGRALDADIGAFGAVRVMVNLNQTGEAAGVAAALAVSQNRPPAGLDVKDVQQTLRDGGSILHV